MLDHAPALAVVRHTLCVCLLALGVGCGRVGFELISEDSRRGGAAGGHASREPGNAGNLEGRATADGGTVVEGTPSGLEFDSFEDVRLLEGVSSELFEDDPTLSEDLLQMVFARTDEEGDEDLWMASRPGASQPFANVVPLTDLNSDARETAPRISPDGLRLLFRSSRDGQPQFFESTRSSRSSPWSPPVLAGIPPEVATLSETADGLRRFATTFDEPPRLIEFWREDTSQPFDGMRYVDELMSSGETDPIVVDGGRVLLFGSRRDGGAGGKDLYVAYRPDLQAPFEPPLWIEGVNTAQDESDPWLSPDQRSLFFTRGGDVYEARR